MGAGAEMTGTIENQYSTALSRRSIERALIDAGKDLDHLVAADLAPLEDFHTMGRFATAQLVEVSGIAAPNRVLDAGSGIGGTARYLVGSCGCAVTAVDLTAEYCDTHRWLNRLVGLDDSITVAQGDVTALPFPDGSFDVVVSQHVQMNVADKALLYSEARRVLARGGRLALWDLTIGDRRALDFPLPWADAPANSHLVTPDELRTVITSAGFAVEHWSDLTGTASSLMQALLAQPHQPLGLHAFVTDFDRKVRNLTAALSDGRLCAIQGVATAIGT
jgi:SAM-dependent methyltransferase